MASKSINEKRWGRCKRGFTLMELLVVISILALLMAILMPALNRVRALGKRVVCLSNVRQIGVANIAYIADNDYYPPALANRGWYNPGSGATQDIVVPWMNLMEKYLPGRAGWKSPAGGSRKFLICPEAKLFIGTWYANCSYGYNTKSFALGRGASFERVWGSPYLAVVKPGKVKSPQMKIVFGDGSYGNYIPPTTHPTYYIDYIDTSSTLSYMSTLDCAPTMRHRYGSNKEATEVIGGVQYSTEMRGCANLSYADGHANSEGTERFLSDYKHWPLQPDSSPW